MSTVKKPPQHLYSKLDKIYYKNPKCFFPGCQKKPINSHTIAENTLYKLHDDLTQVLTLQPSVAFFSKKPDHARIMQVAKKQFSTFPGFCSLHDNEVFKPIDQYDGKLDAKKAALIHYKNICYGICHIETQRLKLEYLCKLTLVPDESSSTAKVSKTLKKLKSGILLSRLYSCLSQHIQRKELLDKMIVEDDFNKINFRFLLGGIDNPIFCGRSSYPLHKDNGLFKLDGYSFFPWITYMTLLTEKENHLVFCWLKSDNIHARRLNRLLRYKTPKSIIGHLAYSCSDSFAIERSLYDKHSKTIIKTIKYLRGY